MAGAHAWIGAWSAGDAPVARGPRPASEAAEARRRRASCRPRRAVEGRGDAGDLSALFLGNVEPRSRRASRRLRANGRGRLDACARVAQARVVRRTRGIEGFLSRVIATVDANV